MATARSRDRAQLLLATARSHPEFAARLTQELAPKAREQVLGELAKAKTRGSKSAPSKPGLRKCEQTARPSFGPHQGLTAQLNLFAKSVAKVS